MLILVLSLLVLAIIGQLLAAVLAIRLITLTRGWVAWVLISSAFFLRAARLIFTCYTTITGPPPALADVLEHSSSLIVSLLLAFGVYWIKPLFLAMHNALQREESSKRELQAVVQMLRESEARYRAFSEASTEGIVIHEQGIVLEVNGIFAEHLGYLPEEMIGQSLFNYIAPESREDIIRRMQAGDAGPYEAVSLHRDGTKTIGELRARNFIYHGREVRLVAIRDITALKQAKAERERLLQEEHTRAAELDATLTSLGDGLIIYSPDGAIMRANPAAERMLAFTEEEGRLPIEERWAARCARRPDGTPLPLSEIPAAIAEHGQPVQGEVLVYPQADGSQLWMSVSASPIFADDRIIGVVATYTDITPLHELQEQQNLLIHLVSHDLRSPLSIIKGHIQLLEDAITKAGVNGIIAQGLQAVDRGIERMNAMIQDLVDAARAEGGQLKLQCEPVDLRCYLPDLLQRSATAMETARIEVNLPDDLPSVSADYNRLERILTNLLSNALKYSDPGTPVFVRARRIDDTVEVSVTDHGQGISPDDIPHLFERFYRVKATTVEGIGLGLYSTKQLVEAHGGHIWVHSEVSTGSTFYFTLPMAPEDGLHA